LRGKKRLLSLKKGEEVLGIVCGGMGAHSDAVFEEEFSRRRKGTEEEKGD